MSSRLLYLPLLSLVLSICTKGISQVSLEGSSSSMPNSSVTFGKPNSQLDTNVSVVSGQIFGVVMTSDNTPVAYATISLSGANGAPVTVSSGEDGRFEIHQVPNGHYDLVASVNLREAHSGVDVINGVNLVTLILPPASGSSGDGRVTVAAGQLAVPGKARRELEKAEDNLHRSKWVEAAGHIEKALALWPRYAEAFLLRAVLDLQQGSPTQAQADAEKAIGCDPSNAKAYVVLGSSFNHLQRWDEAQHSLDRGIAIAPTYWPGHYEMSKALLGKRDFGGALRQAEQASIPATQNYAPLHVVKGYAYLGLGNQAAATQELKTSLKLDPNSPTTASIKKTLDKLQSCATQKENCTRNE